MLMMMKNKRYKCQKPVTLILLNDEHGDEGHDDDDDTKGVSHMCDTSAFFYKMVMLMMMQRG